MGKAKSKTRIERGLVDMSASSEAEGTQRWSHQPDEHDEELTYQNVLAEDSVLYVRHVYQRGRVVDFGLTQMTRLGNRWVSVARADSCHGTVHLHRYNRAGDQIGEPKVLREVFTQQDLEEGYDLADAILDDEWVENLRRWRDGR